MSGLELQARLNAEHCQIPTIFITAHGDRSDAASGNESRRCGVPPKTVSTTSFYSKVFGQLSSVELTAKIYERNAEVRLEGIQRLLNGMIELSRRADSNN